MGGHTRINHKGMSIDYNHRVTRWKSRKNDRMVHKIAKEMYMEIKEGTLDGLTSSTFKQKKNCLSKVERAHNAQKERIQHKAGNNSN